MTEVIEVIRTFTRRNAEKLSYIDFQNICSRKSVNEIKYAFKRIIYRYEYNETMLLDEKLLNFIQIIKRIPSNEQRLANVINLTTEISDPVTSGDGYQILELIVIQPIMNEFIHSIVQEQGVVEICYMMKKFGLLMMPEYMREIAYSASRIGRRDIVKMIFKMFFRLINELGCHPLIEYFNITVRNCLCSAMVRSYHHLVYYILCMLDFNWGVELKRAPIDFKIIDYEGKQGFYLHRGHRATKFKFIVKWIYEGEARYMADYFIQRASVIEPPRFPFIEDDFYFFNYHRSRWYHQKQLKLYCSS